MSVIVAIVFLLLWTQSRPICLCPTEVDKETVVICGSDNREYANWCMFECAEYSNPYFNVFICCGIWTLYDWMGGLVLDNCLHHNYYQINNLTEPFLQHVEENCADYPKDSFACKLVVFTPIAVLVFIFVLILSLSASVIFMCIRLRYYRRYFEYQKSQGFDSASSDEISDESTSPTMKRKTVDV